MHKAALTCLLARPKAPFFHAQKEAAIMLDTVKYYYFYGDEVMQFSFFRIPRQLITHPRFKQVSTDSKLLYGMLLDRMGLSIKNEWYDSDGRVYIYYTIEEICDNLNCGRDKAMKLLAELDSEKGIGLIDRIRQGLGKPTRIYVKRFTTQEIPTQHKKKQEPFSAPFSQVDYSDAQASDFPTSRGGDFRPQEVEETDPNYNNINYTDFSYTDPSIYPPAPSAKEMEMDRCEERKNIKETIDYENLRRKLPYDDLESLLEMIVDVMCSTASVMRIGGEVLPVEAVKRRFRQLDGEHIKYVIDSMRQTTAKIVNIRAYLLTALYHAPVTIGPYYSAAVRHDYGKCVSP